MLLTFKNNRVYRAYTGGNHIDILQGKKPEISRFPEEWIASCALAFNPDRPVLNEGLSTTESGAVLRDLIAKNPEKLLGKAVYQKYHTDSPLLLKLLDSAERLVIQVHPTIEFARQRMNSNFGKTECWYMLQDGGAVYLGFKEGVTRAEWVQAFETQNVKKMLSMLHHFTVQKGDMILVRGGVPHAIDKNSFMVELQEPTDLMVIPERVTPAGKVLAEEKLHSGLGFDGMFDCFLYEGLSKQQTKEKYFIQPRQISANVTRLIGSPECNCFTMDKVTVKGALSMPGNQNFCEGIVLSGYGTICQKSLKSGNSFFISADEPILEFTGEMELLLCYPNVE